MKTQTGQLLVDLLSMDANGEDGRSIYAVADGRLTVGTARRLVERIERESRRGGFTTAIKNTLRAMRGEGTIDGLTAAGGPDRAMNPDLPAIRRHADSRPPEASV